MQTKNNTHIQEQNNVTKKEHIVAIEKLQHCHVCQDKLLFFHQVNYIQNLVIESSKCTACGNEMKDIVYVLN